MIELIEEFCETRLKEYKSGDLFKVNKETILMLVRVEFNEYLLIDIEGGDRWVNHRLLGASIDIAALENYAGTPLIPIKLAELKYKC